MTTADPLAAQRSAIVVGVDGSEPSKVALHWAKFLGERTGRSLEAVMVAPSPASSGWATMGWVAFPTDWNPEESARQVLTDTLTEVFGDAASEVGTTVCSGGAAEQLLHASRNASMLVVGSRGHGGFAGLLLGSVSSTCAEHATCPVMVVHGKDARP